MNTNGHFFYTADTNAMLQRHSHYWWPEIIFPAISLIIHQIKKIFHVEIVDLNESHIYCSVQCFCAMHCGTWFEGISSVDFLSYYEGDRTNFQNTVVLIKSNHGFNKHKSQFQSSSTKGPPKKRVSFLLYSVPLETEIQTIANTQSFQ
jgi:hypothetical protein